MELDSTIVPRMERETTPTVLIADDEPSILVMVSRVITLMNYAVLTVNNGSQAVEIAHQQQKDLYCAILDIDMPGLNGIQAAHAIRQLWPHLPFIFISGYVSPHSESQIAQLHTATLIKKPFTIDCLRKTFLAMMNGTYVSSLARIELGHS